MPKSLVLSDGWKVVVEENRSADRPGIPVEISQSLQSSRGGRANLWRFIVVDVIVRLSCDMSIVLYD
jgi:hypothetical protein